MHTHTRAHLTILSLSDFDDLEVPTTITIPGNSTSPVPIPIRVIDDRIAEDDECITLILGVSTQTVYETHSRTYASVCIQDNDGEGEFESVHRFRLEEVRHVSQNADSACHFFCFDVMAKGLC
jgi:hypothetical protein